jgi:hypothetical protein
MRSLRKSWIDEYIGLISQTSESPVSYHFWCAATVIAATLKRHVFVDRGDWQLLPNMYTIFVGHPGIGKGRAINPAVLLAREANVVNIMSDKLTIQYILETLSKGFTATHATPSGVTFGTDTSCLISAPEMEVFLATSEALPSLSELWEGKTGPSDYGTRGKGLIKITKPCPTLIGGMTLRQACEYMSTRVVSGGFTRRVNFVYAADKAKSIPQPTRNGTAAKIVQDLVDDLRRISMLQGEIKLTSEAWELYAPYYEASGQIDEFDDEATSAYSTSKWVHVLKLAMSIRCAKDDTLVLTELDIEEAIIAVEKCGEDLLKVFRSVGDSDLAASSDRVLRFIEVRGYCTRQDLMGALWRHISSPELDIVLATLETGGIIAAVDRAGKTVFRALPQVKVGP